MESIKRGKEEILCSGSTTNSDRYRRTAHWLVVLTGCACTIGCTTLKKAAIVSSLGTTGALVGNAVSGTAGLVVGGLTTAAVADIATETMIGTKGSGDMSSCAPDNFFTLLGSLVEMGGFFLLGVVLIPMLLGWFLPGPVKLKGRDKKPTNPYLR